MIACDWPRLEEILPCLDPARRMELAVALGLPPGEPGIVFLLDALTEEQQVRRMIRALPERATRSLRQIIREKGRTDGIPPLVTQFLLKAGLILPAAPAGDVLPLEFAFAAEDLLPDESLLRPIARGRIGELRRWRDRLLALLGDSACGEEDGDRAREAWLCCAADVYALLTARHPELLQGLVDEAHRALLAFGPMDGLVRRKEFLARYESDPDAQQEHLTPFKVLEECSGIVGPLLLRGLIASSGTAWQPGSYLHIPVEFRALALAPYHRLQEGKARSLLDDAAAQAYSPTAPRLCLDGQALLMQTTGVLAAMPLRLTHKDAPVQHDLESLARVLGVPIRQAESLTSMALAAGLAKTGDGFLAASAEAWRAGSLPGRQALTRLGHQWGQAGSSIASDRDFLIYLRLAILERLCPAASWITAARLVDLVLTQPGIGRWLEYYWDGQAPAGRVAAAVAAAVEVLAFIGAVETEADERGELRAVHLLPWGESLFLAETPLSWPPPGPVVAVPNHEVYVPLGNGPAALARIGRFAELMSGGPTMVFRLTRASLQQAVVEGVEVAAELAWLEGQTTDGLPENVRASLVEMAERQGEIRLGPAGGFVQVRDPVLRATVVQVVTAAGFRLTAQTDELLVLGPETDLDQLSRQLGHAGLLVAQIVKPRRGRKG